MVNAQEWLESQEEYNTKEKREKITELDISSKDLESSLDLSEFTSLEKLSCGYNKLTSLKLNGCLNLEKLWCYNNQLTELEISNLVKLAHLDCRDNRLTDLKLLSSADKLTYLTVRNNNLSERDLSMFSHLVNLEVLYVGNDDSWNKDNQEKVGQGIYNKFKGSLEPLKGLKNLEELSISSTDIDSGLEYLPKSLKKFWYSTDLRSEAKVKKIEQALKGKLPTEIKKDAEELLDNRTEEIRKDIHQFFEGYSDKEIRELKDPKQTERREKLVGWVKMGGRIVSLTGSALTFTGYRPLIGGIVTTFYPFIEFGASSWEEKFVKSDQSKWEGFAKSSEKLWGDYRDLIESLNFFEVWDNSPLEQWKQVKKLKEKRESAELNSQEKQELAEREKQLKEEVGEKNYQLLPLWEKLQEIYKESGLMTKSEFAQDLWKYWEWKEEKKDRIVGWGNNGRKTQWREIGEMLVRKSENHQGEEVKNTDVVIEVGENIHETEIEVLTESTPLLKTQIQVPPK